MAYSSNEFAVLVEQLHDTPNDPVLKKTILQYLPKMLARAQDNDPMTLYHLAHIYPPNSSQYKQTMRHSANLGCTNAMLVMCRILVQTGSTDDLQKAAYYIDTINKSNDSFIQEQARTLMIDSPQLAKTIQEKAKPKLYHDNIHPFFISTHEKEISNDRRKNFNDSRSINF